jgi:hypothetical protein
MVWNLHTCKWCCLVFTFSTAIERIKTQKAGGAPEVVLCSQPMAESAPSVGDVQGNHATLVKSAPALAKLHNYLLHWVANHKDETKATLPKLEEKLKAKPKMLAQIKRIVQGEEKPPSSPIQVPSYATTF